jgi:hypothetical protein
MRKAEVSQIMRKKPLPSADDETRASTILPPANQDGIATMLKNELNAEAALIRQATRTFDGSSVSRRSGGQHAVVDADAKRREEDAQTREFTSNFRLDLSAPTPRTQQMMDRFWPGARALNDRELASVQSQFCTEFMLTVGGIIFDVNQQTVATSAAHDTHTAMLPEVRPSR